MKSHIEIVSGASEILSQHGNSKIVYITAELQPFSKQQEPDLVFYLEGSSIIYFVEYYQFRKKIDLDAFIDALNERISFANESFEEWTLNYLLAVDQVFIDNQKLSLNNFDIKIGENIRDSQGLADFVLKSVK
jgi:hypothetical protein